MDQRQRVLTNWGFSSFTGWGVYGLNLALAWSTDPDVGLVCANPMNESQIGLDPLRRRALDDTLARSLAAAGQLAAYRDGPAYVAAPLLLALDASFLPSRAAHNTALHGAPNIGVVFAETTRIEADALQRAAGYGCIVAGSTWNARVLQAHGLGKVHTVLQGIDPTLFHPGPRHGLLSDRFLVFSGGKLERRKGQDIVLAAFARFAARRPEAVLVTAWHSPWPELARSVDQSGLAPPLPFTPAGAPDVAAWARAAGVGPDQILDVRSTPNAQMPQLLREMDVAVFPNRAEGGTNLVAMEAMACGVPTILSANTGHLDLIEDGNSFVLERQGELGGVEAAHAGVPGWGESDVDEVVERLEQAYAEREEARRRGACGARTLARLTWSETARKMKDIVLSTPA